MFFLDLFIDDERNEEPMCSKHIMAVKLNIDALLYKRLNIV